MDDARFDDLTRALATSRRGVLKHLVAGLLAGAGGLLGAGAAAAQACAPLRQRCAADDECCSGACDPASGSCVCGAGTDLCGGDCLPLDQYQSDVDNCGGCRARCRRAPECQLPACIAGACAGVPDPAQVGQPCGRGGGEVCGADGTCACPPERPTVCRRGCVDTATDPYNCGACETRCPTTAHGTAVCAGGVCGIVCDAGYAPCGDRCCAADRACCDGVCCPPGACCTGAGACSVEACAPHCEIDGQDYAAGTINPGHDCQVCDPGRSTTSWSPAPDFAGCGGVPGRVCCNGECCSPTECCNPTGFCEECGPHCRIGDEDIDEGTVNPTNPCEVCNPEANTGGWSLAPDDADCGVGQYCCAGQCCPPGQCCNAGACGACRCEIGGDAFDRDEVNPFNSCLVCNPDRNRDGWSPGPSNSACGLTNDRFCCAGDCCPVGQCCNAIGECETCGCVIDGDPVLEDAVNPANTCQVCNPGRDRRGWTVLADDEPCGTDADDRVCCGGVCCPQGECCDGGTCQPCGCEIAGATIEPGTVNPDNPCQVCDPSRARLQWSPVDEGSTCGPNGGQVCCDGVCCAEDQCCLLGACGECLCSIESVNYAAGAPNPANVCEVCNPGEDPFDWSPVDDDSSCGDDRVCCGGHCCADGECCTLGVCQFCGCRIGDEDVAGFALNPENECEWCDPDLDPFAWSPRSDTPCGVDQVCCGGLCCANGECCGLDNVCQSCPCRIDGQFHDAGTANPANPCEVCDPERDPEAWSPILDNDPCGDGSGNVCCDGVCCASGECCHALSGVCGPGPCQCTIGDSAVNEGTPNPDNACEWCKPYASTSGWTPVDDNTRCETALDPKARFCCRGVCCEVDLCCRSDDTCGPCTCTIGGVEYGSGQRNPENDCEFCDPDNNKDDWTVANDHLVCGENLDQFCCAGACCPAGECCHSLEGTCGAEPCGCEISVAGGAITYPEGTINAENRCEVCNPRQDPDGWSPRPDLENCGGAPGPASGHCCQGVCCDNASENCCLSNGTCGRCVCTIDGVEYAAAVSNPANDCEVCIPFDDHTGWTALDNGTGCGETFDRVCCGGVCCPQGECCNAVSLVCEPCGCEIDGATYEAGTANPTNDCEICDPSQSATSWSPAPDHENCGDQQVCCSGVCCQDRTCCGPPWSTTKSCDVEWCGMTDPCDYVDPCGCTIDGVFYPHETVNPANECQWCHAYFSTTSWYDRGDFTRCGPNGDQYCCGEVCCELGACCGDTGVCQLNSPSCRGCVISSHFYRHLQRNPDNPCELCNADLSTTSWSNYENQRLCGFEVVEGVSYERRCCEGICCLGGQCCTVDSVCGSGPCPDL